MTEEDPFVIPKDYKKFNGTFASYWFAYINSVLAFVILPLCYVFILTRNLDTLKQEEFRKRWGNLYLFVKLDGNLRIYWYVAFLARRIIFVGVAFSQASAQVI